MHEASPHRYPHDLSDAEWAVLEPLLPPPSPKGRPVKSLRPLIAEAIFYLVRSGCAERMLPSSFYAASSSSLATKSGSRTMALWLVATSAQPHPSRPRAQRRLNSSAALGGSVQTT